MPHNHVRYLKHIQTLIRFQIEIYVFKLNFIYTPHLGLHDIKVRYGEIFKS